MSGNNTTSHPSSSVTSIEAKLVVLGAQGVGKTSLVSRYINPTVPLSKNVQSTIGASFVTKKIIDPDTSTVVRLQIWDTAGQERFRSISRLYYRGAHACLLCYDVTNEQSFEEMKGWLSEMKESGDSRADEPIIHIVGTKTDIVAEDPSRRQVPFERTIAYMAEHVGGLSQASTPPLTARAGNIQSPDSKRSSGFWNQDIGWDSCHEVSAKDGEGVEEVFRVIARKLIEDKAKKETGDASGLPHFAGERSQAGDDDYHGNAGQTGSFRLGYGDKRRSWLGLPNVGLGGESENTAGANLGTRDAEEARKRGRCC
ncbi:hypothetical protein DV738_g1976, partial [Chaetothyriales sp. CBS 135597]